VAIPTDDPENILGFLTTVDGKPVTTHVEQRVRAQGIDRTDMLRGLGIPLAPHHQGTAKLLNQLPEPDRQQLLRLGLVEIAEEHLEPRWTLQTTHYWEQAFPARRELVIEHRYQPSVGTSVGTSAETAEHKKKYCIDQNLLRTVARARRSAPPDFLPFSEQRIEYILTTGANWSGPIRDFRLVVDKGDPRNLVSFSGNGVKKISPTQFEMRERDFMPEHNLYVLILVRH